MRKKESYDQGLLRKKLDGYRVQPPEEVWSSISARLAGRRRRGFIIISLAAAASIALALTLGLRLWGPSSDSLIATEPSVPVPVTADPGNEALRPDTSIERRMPSVDKEPVSVMAKVATVPMKRDRGGDIKWKERVEQALMEEIKTGTTQVPERNEIQAEGKVIPPGKGPLIPADPDTLNLPDPANVELMAEAEWQDPLPGAQEITDAGRSDRWMIGAAMSPLYSFRDAETEALGSVDNHESGMISYSGGVQVGYRAASRLSFETGVFFTKMGLHIGASGIQLLSRSYEIDFVPAEGVASNLSQVTAVSNSMGNIVARSGEVFVNSYKMNGSDPSNAFSEQVMDASNLAQDGISQHLEYLELPFNLRYTLVDRDLELQLVGGVSTNFLVRNYVTADVTGGREEIGYLTNIRNVNYSGNAGLGMIYHISNGFSLRFEPRFRYFLNSVNDTSLPSTRPYSLGLYTGLNYIF